MTINGVEHARPILVQVYRLLPSPPAISTMPFAKNLYSTSRPGSRQTLPTLQTHRSFPSSGISRNRNLVKTEMIIAQKKTKAFFPKYPSTLPGPANKFYPGHLSPQSNTNRPGGKFFSCLIQQAHLDGLLHILHQLQGGIGQFLVYIQHHITNFIVGFQILREDIYIIF